jgi:hypothetical protein
MEDDPLLDETLATEFFGPAAADPASAMMLREILRDLAADVFPRLAALAAAPDQDARRELHQLRGGIANLALRRAGDRLGRLEQEWTGLAAADRVAGLRRVEEAVRAGLAALRARHPFLAE